MRNLRQPNLCRERRRHGGWAVPRFARVLHLTYAAWAFHMAGMPMHAVCTTGQTERPLPSCPNVRASHQKPHPPWVTLAVRAARPGGHLPDRCKQGVPHVSSGSR